MNIKEGDKFYTRFEGWDKTKLTMETEEGKFMVVASVQSDGSWKVDSIEKLGLEQAPNISTTLS